MTNLQRIGNIITGLVMLGIAVSLVIWWGEDAYFYIIIFFFLLLLVSGIKSLVYYFTMARFMVRGKMALYKGVILLDFAFLTESLADVPKAYILLYLAGIHLFSGVVEILRAIDAKRSWESRWKLKFFHGIVNVGLALCCIVFIKKTNTAVFIYAFGLAYSAIMRIITAFRKTTLVYIG